MRLGEPAGRWVLAATVLGSGMAFLDSTVVNLAAPAISEDLETGIAGIQWVLNGYLLALASLILLGGSLGDRFGRRRVFVVGVVWFAVASLLCGLAPNVGFLIVARILQGIGGALLTPGSLALIQASFVPEHRGRAIGAWSALSGVATAIGPFIGGTVIDAVSWRLIFLINLPIAVAVVAISVRHVPESADPQAARSTDVPGAVLAALGLAGVTYALIERRPIVAVAGVAALVAFVAVERRRRDPMLPVDIFANRQFTGANIVTFAVYAALGGGLFFLSVHLQTVVGWSPVIAGLAEIPITLLMLFLSPRAGELASRIGPRRPMTFGPIVAGIGLALMARIDADASYVADVLPAVVVFGLGLSLTVAPLTTTVLAAAEDRHAGIASGVNNAVARVAGLLAVATLPLLAGLSGDDINDPVAFADGFRTGILAAAVLAAVGGVLAWFLIRDPLAVPAEPPGEAKETYCAVESPPLRLPEASRPGV